MTTLSELADEAYEAVRAMNHKAIGRQGLAAPVVYDVAGGLKATGYGMRQQLEQLADGLLRSLDEQDVGEDDSADPAPRAQAAAELLRTAAQHANVMAGALELAQQAISRQHVRRPVDELEDLEG